MGSLYRQAQAATAAQSLHHGKKHSRGWHGKERAVCMRCHKPLQQGDAYYLADFLVSRATVQQLAALADWDTLDHVVARIHVECSREQHAKGFAGKDSKKVNATRYGTQKLLQRFGKRLQAERDKARKLAEQYQRNRGQLGDGGTFSM